MHDDLTDEFSFFLYYYFRMKEYSPDLIARLETLERHVKRIDGELNDIRQIITDGYDVLSKSNDRAHDVIIKILDRLAEAEERLWPTFHRVFPDHAHFLSDVEAIIRVHTKKI